MDTEDIFFRLEKMTGDCNAMIDGKFWFRSSRKRFIRTYENIQKLETSQGNFDITGCLLDYNYFKNYYKIIGTKLCKQQSFPIRHKKLNLSLDKIGKSNNELHIKQKLLLTNTQV